MAEKIRLDALLVDLGFFASREKAQTTIMMNGVRLAGTVVNKAGKQINLEDFREHYEADQNYLIVEDKLSPYVSRGAYKLEAAHKTFNLDLKDKVIMDLGSSTGGFTDYCLQMGAKKLISIDVGKNQLHYKLQNHPQILSLEGINFRYFDPESLPEKLQVDLVVADLSFISSLLILQKVKELYLAKSSKLSFVSPLNLVFLIKPQFEAGKEIMDKCQGVITDNQIRERVLTEVLKGIVDLGFVIESTIESPLKGAKGNIEYLAMLKLCCEENSHFFQSS